MTTDPRPRTPGACANCDSQLAGPFCARCGQEDRDLDLGLLDLVREALGAFLSFDRRLLATLGRLVAVPGHLTEVYLSGRRRAFVPPFKLYLGISIVAFLLLGQTSTTMVHVSEGAGATAVGSSEAADRGGDDAATADAEDADEAQEAESDTAEGVLAPVVIEEEGGGFRQKFLRELQEADENPEELNERFQRLLPKTIFFLVPAFAGILGVAHFVRRRPFAHFLVFSVHLHAVGFVAIGVGSAMELLGSVDLGDVVTALGFLWCFVWLALGQRRVFGTGRWTTWLVAGLVSAAYVAVVLVALIATLVVLLVFLSA